MRALRTSSVGLLPRTACGWCSGNVESSTLRGDGMPIDFLLRQPQRVLNPSRHIQLATEVCLGSSSQDSSTSHSRNKDLSVANLDGRLSNCSVIIIMQGDPQSPRGPITGSSTWDRARPRFAPSIKEASAVCRRK